MPQDKIDTVISLFLLATGATAYNAPEIIEITDHIVLLAFHLLSVISVGMVVVINRKKFINEVNSWFRNGKN